MAATSTSTQPPMRAPQPSAASHPYTCNTCQVAFKGSDLQRGHMQSDWHRYNLKRRVASLPPLTSEIFAEKVLANQASAQATAALASFEKICSACQRTYFSENAYRNHLQSQKHKAKLLQLANEPDVTTEAETESLMSSAFSLGESNGVAPEAEDSDSAAEEEFAKVINGIKQTSLKEEDGDPISRRPTRPRHSTISTPAAAAVATNTSTSSTTSTSSAPTLQCLFCNIISTDIPSNVLHMSKAHGLFIPEQAYLVDLPGLLSYLHDRVHALHECLYCGQLKYTTPGIQTHMRDKGHCMIAFESEAEMVEVGDFYDFRSTYSDDADSEEEEEEEEEDSDDQDPTPSNGVKLGAPRAATYTASDGDEDEDDWEEDDDSDADDAKAPSRPRRARQAYEIDGELHLPSGRTAGHRSLARYYRQNLHNYPTPSERLVQQQEQAQRLLEDGSADSQEDTSPDGTVAQQRGRPGRAVVTRANGGMGLLSAPAEKKRQAAKLEMKDKRKADRAANQFRAGNERQGNYQKHYRDPLLQ